MPNLQFHTDILAIIGILIVLSFVGSKILQRIGAPQVVGFIVIGLFMGPSFLNWIPVELCNELTFISEIALGLIGFDIGSHLMAKDLRQMGTKILIIVMFEALGAFFLVTLSIYLLTQDWVTALLFGSISTATAPASTVDVLAEYDSAGPLTTTLLCVVGLDDALSLVLFSIGSAVAESFLVGSAMPTITEILAFPLFEIGGSLLFGGLMGLLLNWIFRQMKSHHDAMSISIGFIFICVGVSNALELSFILVAMTLGIVIVNLSPKHGRYIRFTIEQAGPVIYILFFTLVGARFNLNLLPTIGLIGLVYLLGRTFGKYTGAWFGGMVSNTEPVVRNNLGFGLLAQMGVAIGLAMTAANRFSVYGEEGAALGLLVLNVVTGTTFIVQIIGPILVKYAISRAGEVGKARLSDDAWASEGGVE